jgi:hypothetical protein
MSLGRQSANTRFDARETWRSESLVLNEMKALMFPCLWFIFSRIKKGEGQGKEKCHAKSMMSKETNVSYPFFFSELVLSRVKVTNKFRLRRKGLQRRLHGASLTHKQLVENSSCKFVSHTVSRSDHTRDEARSTGILHLR